MQICTESKNSIKISINRKQSFFDMSSLFQNNIKRKKKSRVVSTQLGDNGSERESYAQAQKQIQKRR
jgi:hypothetical protein